MHDGKIEEGAVVVIRYEVPKGGPGMSEMLAVTGAFQRRGLGDKVAGTERIARCVPVAVIAVFAMLIPLAGCARSAPVSPSPAPAPVLTAATLRLAIGPSEVPMLRHRRDEEATGLAVEVGEALAMRLGVPARIDLYGRGAELQLRWRDWDVAFLAADPALSELDLTMLLESDYVALGPIDSPSAIVWQLDRPGVRVAAVRRSTLGRSLATALPRATVVLVDDWWTALRLLRSGAVHAFAYPRHALLVLPEPLDGLRVLDGRFGATVVAIAAPRARRDLVAYVHDFVRDAKAYGLLERAVESAGLRGVRVAR